jgi:flagellar FliJ protein
MKRFFFPLRSVAVLRAHRQARAQEIFAAAVHAYVQAEEAQSRVVAQQRTLAEIIATGRRATFSAADEISFWGAYRSACAEQVIAEHAVIAARVTMEKRRAEYLEAHRAVKVIEQLEHKARVDYRRASERTAQNELDELAGLCRARRIAATTRFS